MGEVHDTGATIISVRRKKYDRGYEVAFNILEEIIRLKHNLV